MSDHSYRIVSRAITIRVLAGIISMEVLSVGSVVDIVDRDNVSVGFGRGKLCNVLPIQEEGKCIVKISVGILVILLTSKDVVERYNRHICFRGALESELDPASIKDGMLNITLKITVGRLLRELRGFLITSLIIEVRRLSTRQHDTLIGDDWDGIAVGVKKKRNGIGREVFGPSSPGGVVEVTKGVTVGEVACAFIKDGGGGYLLELDVSVLGHEDTDQFVDSFLLKVHLGIDETSTHKPQK
jgi:hypothetical protein